jgi:hypothetical protein
MMGMDREWYDFVLLALAFIMMLFYVYVVYGLTITGDRRKEDRRKNNLGTYSKRKID